MGGSSGSIRSQLRALVRRAIAGRAGSGPRPVRWRDRARVWLRAPGAPPWNIFLPPGFPEDGTVAWRGPGGETGRGPLTALPDAARYAAIRAWTPAVETLLTVAHWPSRGRRRLAQALPYLLEEQLLAEPESLVFAHRETDAGVCVAVTAKERLAAWRAAMDEERLSVTFCPVTLALPWRPRTWSCRFAEGQWVVRTGPFSGFGAAGHATQVPAVFRQALEEAAGIGAAPDSIILFAGDEALRALMVTGLGIPVAADARPLADGEGPTFRLGETGGAVGATSLAALRALQPALIALALVLVSGFARILVDWVRLAREEARIDTQMTALFRASFPHVPVLDPSRQMRQGVARLAARADGAGRGFLAVLTDASPALTGLARGALTRLSYRHGQVRCAVRLVNFEALAALEHNLLRGGLSIRVARVMSRRGGVEALVTMTEGSL